MKPTPSPAVDLEATLALTAYVDGELPEAEARALEARLAADPDLRALEQSLRRTVALVKALPAPEPSAGLRRRVLAAVEAPTWRERLSSLFSFPVGVGAVAAAGLAAVLLMGRPDAGPTLAGLDGEALELAFDYEVLSDLEAVGLSGADDVEVVLRLDEVEAP